MILLGTACVHTNYDGKLPATDVFEIIAVGPAVLGKHDAKSPDHNYAYYRKGRYKSGLVTLDLATDVGPDRDADDPSDTRRYDNRRTIKIQSTGGKKFQIRPLPKNPGGSLLGVISLTGQYQGYEVFDVMAQRVVMRVP